MEPLVESKKLTIARGNLYLSFDLYETYLKGAECIALSRCEDGLLVIPLISQSAGGLLLKVRTARGDRVVAAQEFLRQNGYPESFEEQHYPVRWLADRAALLVIGVARVV